MNRVEFDSTKRSLDETLRKARDGLIQLPDFQRGWVWDDDGLRGVLASISRSFPVGALMTLQTGGEVHFKPRLIEGAPDTNATVKPEALLLDGQQRITSLYQTTMRREVVKTLNSKKQVVKLWYYIDMVKALDPNVDRLDAIVGIREDKRITENFGREVKLDLCSQELEFETCMFPLNRVFDSDEWQMGFCKYWNYAPEKMELWFRFQNDIIAAFKQYQIPVIELGKSTSREAVCLVFEKVNTGGKKLDAFELLTAIFASRNHELRKDWYGDKKAGLPGIKGRLDTHDVLKSLQSTDFLQTITLLHTLDQRREDQASGKKSDEARPVICTRDALLNLSLEGYLKYRDPVEQAYKKAAKFLREQKIYWNRDVPYVSQLVPLAAILVEIGDKWNNHTTRQKLTQWYWCGVFGELYGSTVETRFARDLIDVPVWIDGGPIPRTMNDSFFRAERLRTLRSRLSAAYKGFNALLMKTGSKDFKSGQSFDDSVFSADQLDIHHIFPKAWCVKHGKLAAEFDSIINKTPISLNTNRSIGGAAPSQYLARLRDQGSTTDAALDEHLKTHAINPVLIRADDFDAFFAARRSALLDLVAAVIGSERVDRGPQVPSPLPAEEDAGFDDDAVVEAATAEPFAVAAE
ncbi:GmrSD restriction endonuclease domain-containing protein [Methylobacterium oxalidis]|uniref:GmrSD restriction endonuclease domain-containing protein n=1 Tax=Methylobacterium oxalidis TaxID=944322 RepID=UPI00331571D3